MMFMLYATHNQSTALVRPIVFKERVVVAFCSTGTVYCRDWRPMKYNVSIDKQLPNFPFHYWWQIMTNHDFKIHVVKLSFIFTKLLQNGLSNCVSRPDDVLTSLHVTCKRRTTHKYKPKRSVFGIKQKKNLLPHEVFYFCEIITFPQICQQSCWKENKYNCFKSRNTNDEKQKL